MVSVPLCYKYLFFYDFLFIHSKASIGVLEKGYLNIRKHPSIGDLKKQLLRKFLHTKECTLCILSSKTSRVEFFLSTLVGLPGIAPENSLE